MSAPLALARASGTHDLARLHRGVRPRLNHRLGDRDGLGQILNQRRFRRAADDAKYRFGCGRRLRQAGDRLLRRRHCASADAFALVMLGHPDVKLYDASLSEWAIDPNLPMETG